MAKIPCSYYSQDERQKECKNDLNSFRTNPSESHHPLQLERNFVNALNSTKIDKFMAKPFISSFSCHSEGISHLTKDSFGRHFMTSSFDNEISLYDIYNKEIIYRKTYDDVINGISLQSDKIFVTQGSGVDITRHSYNNDKIIIDEYDSKSVGGYDYDTDDGKLTGCDDDKAVRYDCDNTDYYTHEGNKMFIDHKSLVNSIDVFENQIASACSNSFVFSDIDRNKSVYPLKK